MPKYRVRDGCTHGARGEHGPGAIVELTEREATGFFDKLTPVPERPVASDLPDLSTYPNVAAVLAAVDSGELDAAAALAAERDGAQRVTLIRQLEALAGGES